MMRSKAITEKPANVCCCESKQCSCLILNHENSNESSSILENIEKKNDLCSEEKKEDELINNCENQVNIQNRNNRTNEEDNGHQDRQNRQGMLFDMFGDMGIEELNFEEIDPTCASVDSLLFDAFPQHMSSETCDKIKTEEFSSSSFSSTSGAKISEEQANSKMESIPVDSMLPNLDADKDNILLGDEVEVEMPLLTLGRFPTESSHEMNKLCESASSESSLSNFPTQAEMISSASLHALHAQQLSQQSNYHLRQVSHHEISPEYFQQVMLNENMLASMMQNQLAGYTQNSHLLSQFHNHPVHGAQGTYYGHPSFASGQQGFGYDSVGIYQARLGSESSGKKGSSSKRYKLTQPSKFCHVCVRSGDQVRLAPCANVTSGLCRKAVCEKCFAKHGFVHEWNAASLNYNIIAEMNNRIRDTLPEHAWTCFHCRSQCPPTAQCKIYARTNKRRHNILKKKKAEKERAAAERTTTPGPGSILKGNRKVITTARG